MSRHPMALPVAAGLAAALLLACGSEGSAPGETWVGTRLTASDGTADDQLGASVALSADGNTVVAGAAPKDGDRGAAYVYRWNGASWVETKLTASDPAAGDLFGTAVAASSDGDTVAVGAPGKQSGRGAVYVLDWNGAAWSETKLVASDAAPQGVGASVSLSPAGDALAVGPSAGATYLFARSGAGWSETARLNTGKSNVATSLSSDADTVAQGWRYQSAVAVYRASGAWGETLLAPSDGVANDMFGCSVATFSGGDAVLVGAFDGTSATPGAAYVYRWTGAAWIEEKLVPSSGEDGDGFGVSVAASVDGTTLVVGADRAGAAWVYGRVGSGWTERKLTATDGATSVQFGGSVSASGDGRTVAVGARRADASEGAAYVYRLQP